MDSDIDGLKGGQSIYPPSNTLLQFDTIAAFGLPVAKNQSAMRLRSFTSTLLIFLGGVALVGARAESDLPGLVMAREAGGHLSLNVENNALVLRFYDVAMNQIAPDAPRAMAFWRFRNQRNRQPMTPQGNALVSPQRIYPPFAYTINISLLTMEDNDVTESHNFDMRFLQTTEETTASSDSS